MLKRNEINDPRSCLSKAKDDEMLFVLLESDPAAAATIRFWIDERIRLGINRNNDAKIVEAERCACHIMGAQALNKITMKGTSAT